MFKRGAPMEAWSFLCQVWGEAGGSARHVATHHTGMGATPCGVVL